MWLADVRCGAVYRLLVRARARAPAQFSQGTFSARVRVCAHATAPSMCVVVLVVVVVAVVAVTRWISHLNCIAEHMFVAVARRKSPMAACSAMLKCFFVVVVVRVCVAKLAPSGSTEIFTRHGPFWMRTHTHKHWHIFIGQKRGSQGGGW